MQKPQGNVQSNYLNRPSIITITIKLSMSIRLKNRFEKTNEHEMTDGEIGMKGSVYFQF
jgi:hypothetical protein